MAFWLLKADPGDYGYDDLKRDGKTTWDGVSNNLALKHIRAVAKGDQALIYHTGSEKSLVGLATITSAPYPDPEQDDERLAVFDIKPKRKLRNSVPLSEIKADKRFKDFELVRMPRLSVMPVPEPIWKRLLQLAGEKG